MSKRTPGPWHVGVGGNQHANRVWTADMRPIANLCSMGASPADIDPEAQANARLIAAAPELLDALKRAELFFAHLKSSMKVCGHTQALMDQIDAALAKATDERVEA